MYEVRVECNFAAAHFLRDYNGKCENLHGHNYKVFAHVCGTHLNEGGMLLDFSLLKKSLRDVCKEMDHTNLNDNPCFNQNPSAERIAEYIYNRLLEKLKANHDLDLSVNSPDSVRLFAVDVFETETSRARFSVPQIG
ncbi:MAG: 6-carboxytetrahydropterin synthase QueD [Treponema sp.]|nr:6-carboxytetrahydropterin synthase QueD [Treponema sp.]